MPLAAGRGERMEPLSGVVGKPALEVAGRPLLASSLANLRGAGCARVVVNLHRHPAQVAAAARAADPGPLAFSWEPNLLGGRGGVAAARPLLGDGDVLVGNTDSWGSLELGPVLAARADDAVVLALIPHPDPARWSSVVLDGDGRVVRFLPPGAGSEPGRFLFTGFQLLGRDVVAALPPGPGEMAALWDAARRRGCLRGVSVEGVWREAGAPSAYRELAVETAGPRSWVHPAADVEAGSRIERSAVGAGCRVERGCSLVASVLTAGAAAQGGSELAECVLAGPVTVTGETLARTLVLPDLRVPLA